MRRLVAWLVMLVALVGCTADASDPTGAPAAGGDRAAPAAATFADDFAAATAAFEAQAGRAMAAGRAALDGDADVRAAHEQLAAATAAAQDRYGALVPPSHLAGPVDELVVALRDLGRVLDAAVAADTNDGEGADAAIAEMTRALVAVGDARAAVEQGLLDTAAP